MLTIIIPLGVIVIIVVPVRGAEVLLEAAGAQASDPADVEGVVGADALALEEVLVAVSVAGQIDLAAVRQVDDGLTDVTARGRDVIAVKLKVGECEVGEGREEEKLLCVEHDGRLLVGWRRIWRFFA